MNWIKVKREHIPLLIPGVSMLRYPTIYHRNRIDGSMNKPGVFKHTAKRYNGDIEVWCAWGAYSPKEAEGRRETYLTLTPSNANKLEVDLDTTKRRRLLIFHNEGAEDA